MERSEIPHGGCPRAEYETARLVLMHTPGEEVFCGAMHPAAALYEKYMDVKRAGDEHRAYVEFLRNEAGAEVVTVREILERTETGELREFASRFLTYSVRVLAAEDRVAAEEYRRETLEQMTKEELIRVILLRPTLYLRRSVRNTGWKAEYALRPLMNLFYMRDQMINTPRGPVIGRMNSEQRAEEADVAEFCLRQMGIKAVHRVSDEGAYLEGGDYIPFGDSAFIGTGLRTTQEAVEEMMREDVMGHECVVVVRDRKCKQNQMHLDTYFNVIDRDLATLGANRLKAERGSDEWLTADVYERDGGRGYRMTEEGVPFVEYLRREGVEIIPINLRDELRYGNNYLTVSARRIVGVAGQSEELRRMLAERGVRTDWLDLSELTHGYGAAHCMTQVIRRG